MIESAKLEQQRQLNKLFGIEEKEARLAEFNGPSAKQLAEDVYGVVGDKKDARIFELEQKLDRLEEVRVFAQIVADDMQTTPGGDAYDFHGSMNDIDALREALTSAA